MGFREPYSSLTHYVYDPRALAQAQLFAHEQGGLEHHGHISQPAHLDEYEQDGREPYSSLTHYVYDPLVNLTAVALVLLGGLGFLVWRGMGGSAQW